MRRTVVIRTPKASKLVAAVPKDDHKNAPVRDRAPAEAVVPKLIEEARRAAKEAGMCGEAVVDPDLIPRLVGVGITDPNMGAPSIPGAKKAVSEI